MARLIETCWFGDWFIHLEVWTALIIQTILEPNTRAKPMQAAVLMTIAIF
jgi:hypothetical protein